jgi:hypothetical protein
MTNAPAAKITRSDVSAMLTLASTEGTDAATTTDAIVTVFRLAGRFVTADVARCIGHDVADFLSGKYDADTAAICIGWSL